jgi:hypothetical protein
VATRSDREAPDGPWRRGSSFEFTRRLGLDPSSPKTRAWLIVATVALAWVPFTALSLAASPTSAVPDSVFVHAEVHARLLGVLTLVLAAEAMLELRVDLVIRSVVDDAVLSDQDRDLWLARLVDRRRVDETNLFSAACLLVVYIVLLFAYLDLLPGWAERWMVHAARLPSREAGAASWWYVLVAQPLMWVCAGRWLFRWSSFGALLWRLARLGPVVLAPHVDRAGGLGFMRLPIDALRVFILGLGGAIAAVWFDEIAAGTAALSTFADDLIGFLALAVAMLYLPYLGLTKALVRTRDLGVLRYDALMRQYLVRFEQRWLAGQAHEDLLGHPDLSGLADLGVSAAVVEEMRSTIPKLADLRSLTIVAVLPFLLVALAYGPSTAELIRALLARIAGG